MTKPDWCPQRVWDEGMRGARSYAQWLHAGNSTGELSEHAIDGLADSFARAILAAEKREREACAVIVENMPIQIYRDTGIGPVGRSCKPATFEDAAQAIRYRNGE